MADQFDETASESLTQDMSVDELAQLLRDTHEAAVIQTLEWFRSHCPMSAYEARNLELRLEELKKGRPNTVEREVLETLLSNVCSMGSDLACQLAGERLEELKELK